MKVVHVLTSLLRGGAEENTIATCRAQIARGYQVSLICGRNVDEELRDSLPAALEVIRVPSLVREVHPLNDVLALGVLMAKLRALAPDVVHTHQSKAGILGRMAAIGIGVPIILHGVHILPFVNVSPAKKMLYLGLERLVAGRTDAFISVAKGMHDTNLEAGLGSKETNHIVYSGMDIARFKSATSAPDAPDGQLIVIVAALEPRKRHSAFLDIFAELVADRPALKACFFGVGPEEDALRAKVAALGLSENVRFMGYRTDVENWIAAADLCVLPSMREGLPRVVVQYVAVGRPVAVTELPGIEEIVKHGENGFVVGPDDFEALKTAIGRILDSPRLADRMSAAARRQSLARWSVDRMEPQINAILTDIAARKGLSSQLVHQAG